MGSLGSSNGSNHPPAVLLIGAKNNSFGSGASGRKGKNPDRLSNYSSHGENSNYNVAQIEEATVDAENEEDTPLSQKSRRMQLSETPAFELRSKGSEDFFIEEEVKEIQYGIDFAGESIQGTANLAPAPFMLSKQYESEVAAVKKRS